MAFVKHKRHLLGGSSPLKPHAAGNASHRETHFRAGLHYKIRLTVRRIWKGDALRKREHFIGLWLNDTEYKRLLKQCELSGLSTSALIRHAISGVEIRPRPPDTYAALLRELSAIGNNVNQLAYWANARKGVTEAEIKNATALVREAWRLVKETL